MICEFNIEAFNGISTPNEWENKSKRIVVFNKHLKQIQNKPTFMLQLTHNENKCVRGKISTY